MAVTVSITTNIAGNKINEEDLPQTVELTAVGNDSSDPGALFDYSWYILDIPTNSTATLSADVGATIEFDADLWGTYRIFCVAQNSATEETSSTNPISAPTASFVDISVLSEKYDLEKPAKSQRNWHPQLWHLIDTVEDITIDSATFSLAGKSEIATAYDIAKRLDKTNSESGVDFLAVSADQLYDALHPTANGALAASSDNDLRERIKDISDEAISEASIGDLSDFSLTSVADGDMFTWNASAGEIRPVDPQTLLNALEPDQYFSEGIFLNQADDAAGPTETTGVTEISFKKAAATSVKLGYDHDNDKIKLEDSAGGEMLSITESGVLRLNDSYSFPSTVGSENQILKVNASGNLVFAADDGGGVDGLTSNGSTLVSLDSGYSFNPNSNGASLGSTLKRWNLDATSGDFTGSVRVDGSIFVGASEDGQIVSQAAGDLTVGNNAASNNQIQLVTDRVKISSPNSAAGILELYNQSSNYVGIRAEDTKTFTSYDYRLPSAPGSEGSFFKVGATSGGITNIETGVVTQKLVYTTHVSREVSEEGSFDGSGNLIFAGNQQACIYWFKNTTGSSIQLDNTFIHIGEMKNVTLSFSLVTCTGDADAISNSWTQVGSTFTLTNSSGVDNVIGQATDNITTNFTLTNGSYLGIVCTDIPVANRDDRRISITFECNYQL